MTLRELPPDSGTLLFDEEIKEGRRPQFISVVRSYVVRVCACTVCSMCVCHCACVMYVHRKIGRDV